MLDRTKLIIAALMFVAAAGCSTVEGAGDDIEDAGDAVSDAARDTRDNIEDAVD